MPEPTQREVYFAEYEEFLRLRNAANNGIMALGAGASLSAHFLQLASGSKNTLSDMFPAVNHIQNFNLKPDHALQELSRAEYLLASMAIPYHLGILESFCGGLERALKNQVSRSNPGKAIKTRGGDSITKKIEEYLINPIPHETGQVLNLLKGIRDDLMHKGGKAGNNYSEIYKTNIEPHIGHWKLKPGGNVTSLKVGDEIILHMSDLLLTLAAVKLQAREINYALQESLPREFWVKMMVRDYLALDQQQHLNDEQHLRRCAGFARNKFSSLRLDKVEFEAELLSKLKGKMGL